MLDLGIWTGYFRDLSPEESVKMLVEKGWTHLELANEHANTLLQRGTPQITGEKFRRYSDEIGAHIPQGHLWLKCDVANNDQAEVIEKLKPWLDLFLGIGIKSAVIHAGGRELLQQGYELEKVNELRIKAFRSLTGYVQNTDLILCIENTVHAIADADSLVALIEAVGSPNLGICLDTGHLNIKGGPQGEFIRKAKPYLKALHIDDNEGTSDQHLMPYGKGNVNWIEVIAALKEIEYHGAFNLEIPGENKCPIPIRCAKLDYLKTIINLMII